MKKTDFNKNVLDKNDKTRKLFVLSMFVPIILIEAVFFFGVNIQGLIMAFQKELPNGKTLFSFDNFIRIFTEGFEGSSAVFFEGIRNSLLFFGLSVFVMMPISVIVAYFLNKKIVGYKFFRVVLYLPNILPGIIIATIFRHITAPDGAGVIASICYKYGWNWPNLFGDSRYAIWSLLFYSYWTSFGAGFLLYYTAMKRISPEIIESAELDGVKWYQEIVYIDIPLVWPTIAMTILTTLPTLLMSSGAVLLFTRGEYGTQTLAYWLFDQVRNRANMNYSAAVSLFFSFITLPLMFFSKWLMDRVPDTQY